MTKRAAYPPWTAEEDEMAVTLRDSGMSCGEVGRRVGGRTAAAVICRLGELRSHGSYVPRSPSESWTSEQDELALCLRDDGVKCAEIGQRVGKSKNAVIGRLRRLDNGCDDSRPVITMEDRLRAGVNFPPRWRCVWPYGDVGEPGFHFCGARAHAIEASYCAEHHALAWVRPRNWR